MAARRSTRAKPRCLRRLFGKSKYDLSFLCPDWLEYSSIDKMAKYDWNTFRNYVAFLADEMASGTMHPHHDSELISWYHDAFLTWDHYLNNIVLFYHDSPITRSHFMDPTDRAKKGFYCTCVHINQRDEGSPTLTHQGDSKGIRYVSNANVREAWHRCTSTGGMPPLHCSTKGIVNCWMHASCQCKRCMALVYQHWRQASPALLYQADGSY